MLNKIKSKFKNIVIFFQKTLVMTIYFFLKEEKEEYKKKAVIGVEVAGFLKRISDVLNHHGFNLSNNKYYNYSYDYEVYRFSGFLSLIYRCYLLALVARRYNMVTYVGSDSFVLNNDGRRWEFNFLKSKKIKLVCFFLGTDIRSFSLLEERFKKEELDTIATYHNYVLGIDLLERESRLKLICCVADKYSDAIFNYPVDQISYIRREVYYIPYVIDDDCFYRGKEKWTSIDKIVVLHCPTSPIIKGTPLVRAAIKKLKQLGYDFEYVELQGVSNDVVRQELKRAHIVLNQFYAFVPGVFGIESLAANTVLLTSADKNIEPMLPDGANDAWIVTPYWDIFDNLRNVLDSPIGLLEKQAEVGQCWALEHASFENARIYLEDIYRKL